MSVAKRDAGISIHHGQCNLSRRCAHGLATRHECETPALLEALARSRFVVWNATFDVSIESFAGTLSDAAFCFDGGVAHR